VKEIKILGAGISGLTAAINLAKAGYKVTVYEKNKDVGMRFHGDLEGIENWSEKQDVVEQIKEMGIKINFDCDPFRNAVVTNGKIESSVSFKRSAFYLVKRGTFNGTLDYSLKKQALEEGVKIVFNKIISSDKVDVVATGPIIKDIFGIDNGITFKTESKDMAVLVFNDEMAYRGYSYLLISKGYGVICDVIQYNPKDTNRGAKIKQSYLKTREYFTKEFKIDINHAKKCGGIGCFALKHKLEIKHRDNKTLYVGEAAGLQDVLMGFGMRYAFESGYLAADSIINNVDYETLAKKRFGNKLKASLVNRYLYELLGDRFYTFITKHPGLGKRALYIVYDYTLLHRILYPLAVNSLKKEYPWLEK
jgi:flavin-dependent dehydrogenase